MIILCHFQAPLVFTVCDKKFAVLRTVYHIQAMILYNIYILFLLIVNTLCPSKKDLCSSFSLEFFMEVFIRSQITIIRHILGGSEKNLQQVKNFPLTLF